MKKNSVWFSSSSSCTYYPESCKKISWTKKFASRDCLRSLGLIVNIVHILSILSRVTTYCNCLLYKDRKSTVTGSSSKEGFVLLSVKAGLKSCQYPIRYKLYVLEDCYRKLHCSVKGINVYVKFDFIHWVCDNYTSTIVLPILLLPSSLLNKYH